MVRRWQNDCHHLSEIAAVYGELVHVNFDMSRSCADLGSNFAGFGPTVREQQLHPLLRAVGVSKAEVRGQPE